MGTREVAGRSGTSLATIYRRWPSRQDMLLDVITHLIEEDTAVPDTGDLRTDVLTVLDTMRPRRRAYFESLPDLAERIDGAGDLDTRRDAFSRHWRSEGDPGRYHPCPHRDR